MWNADLNLKDRRHLDAAEGWLYLGNWQEANEELECISPLARAHPEVLVIRYEVYAKGTKWDAALEVARAFAKCAPANKEGWIHSACALHELKQTAAARDLLLTVAHKFDRDWNLNYDLACYYSQLSQFEESKDWFKKAMLLDERRTQRIARDDPDLKPLWDSMSGSIWTRG